MLLLRFLSSGNDNQASGGASGSEEEEGEQGIDKWGDSHTGEF